MFRFEPIIDEGTTHNIKLKIDEAKYRYYVIGAQVSIVGNNFVVTEKMKLDNDHFIILEKREVKN